MLGGIPVSELNQLDDYWQAFPALREALFAATTNDYTELKISADELKQTINQHKQIKAFIQKYTKAFSDFDDYLKAVLINKIETLNIPQQKVVLSKDLFARLRGIDLIDKYHAYQLLDNSWQTIATDLEVLQTEGFAVSRQVDPNMVTKKKAGKDVEVQDGWVGHIMPFELVQSTYLNDELQTLKEKENRLAEISSEYEAVLDSLSEEEKEADTIKEGGDGFVNAAVSKEVKQLIREAKENGAFDEDSFEAKLIKVDALITEEKALKKAVKDDSAALHLQTKATIEGLTDAQVFELLELKWISPLLTELHKLPDILINTLTSKLHTLAEKYATTYGDVEKAIANTEKELSDLIDQLTGNEADMHGLAELKSFLQGE